MATLKLVDNTEIVVNDDVYSQIDTTIQFTAYCANYTELANIAAKLTDDNLKTVTLTDISGGVNSWTNMICSTPKLYIMSDNGTITYVIRIRKKTTEDTAQDALNTAIQQFDDDAAMSCKSLYPEFNSVIGKQVEKGFKLVYYNILYKTAQATTISIQYKPGDVGTESIYTRIDEEHKGASADPIPYYGNQILEKGKIYVDEYGTKWICTNGSGIAVFASLSMLQAFVAMYSDATGTAEDPIIYAGGLALEKDKYYVQYETDMRTIYLCTRDTGIPVYQDLKDLVGLYVEVYDPSITPPTEDEEKPTTPGTDEDGEEDTPTENGTYENPIAYNNSMALENGKYYIQDDVIYLCTRDTGIAVYNDLKDLVNIYVQVATQE